METETVTMVANVIYFLQQSWNSLNETLEEMITMAVNYVIYSVQQSWDFRAEEDWDLIARHTSSLAWYLR